MASPEFAPGIRSPEFATAATGTRPALGPTLFPLHPCPDRVASRSRDLAASSEAGGDYPSTRLIPPTGYAMILAVRTGCWECRRDWVTVVSGAIITYT